MSIWGNPVSLGYNVVAPTLPAEYQEVEYVKSAASGSQYVETGVLPSFDTRVIVDYRFVSKKSGNYAVGAGSRSGDTSSKRFFPIQLATSLTTERFAFGTVNPTMGFSRAQRRVTDFNNEDHQIIVADYFLQQLSSSQFAGNDKTIWLFGAHDTGDQLTFASEVKIYSFKAMRISSGIWICDLVPCYRISDGEIGFYDRIGRVFRVNLGDGALEKGPDVN